MSTVDYIKNALDEMDRLAAEHIRLQSDPTSEYKVVRAAEQLRDRQEAYVERESRANWLRQLLPVVEAARELKNTPLPMPIDAGEDLATLKRAKAATMLSREFQARFKALLDALAALDGGSEGGE